ncbi:MAG: arginine--tRNA ligase [Chitinophagales bacterium]
MDILSQIKATVQQAVQNLFQVDIAEEQIVINETDANFEGDFTIVTFPLVKILKQAPDKIAQQLGDTLLQLNNNFVAFNVVKGFLNISIAPQYWIDFIQKNFDNPIYFETAKQTEKILIEYSSPNTNKPIHLGHIRNNVLGYALTGLYKASGYNTHSCNLINDRGIHICKSMLAWQKFANGETPESSGMKGDHFVGKYYVLFNTYYKEEIAVLINNGMSEDEAKQKAPILLEAQAMLKQWEDGKEAVVQLWKTMNDWVYSGFKTTYENLGISFDKYYYESNTYLLGKAIVEEGLQKNIFFKKENNSVWIDLTADGLDEKLLLRSDGTSVYMTQDIGTADLKYQDFKMDKSIYVVGNEQDYHFKVLKLILEKLGRPHADGLTHFSYGMVELPDGKLKSREGNTVDADMIMAEMIQTAKEQTEALGKIDDFTEAEKTELYKTIGLGALKFFMLRVDPKKRILFNPKESIDLHGYTAPFVQYSYARAKSILRNAANEINLATSINTIAIAELDLIKHLYQYKTILVEATQEMQPSKWIDYIYETAKLFNKFYNECSILNADNEAEKQFRLALTQLTANCIKNGFAIVGIQVPEKM